jgi:hypothetical protein
MDPRCAVEHSHDSSIWYEFRRAYLDHQNIHSLTGLHLAPDLRHVLSYSADLARSLFGELWADDGLSFATKLHWTAKIPAFAFSQNLAQFLGPLSDTRRRHGLWGAWDRLMRRGI